MAKSNNLFTADDFSKDGGKKFPWWIIALVVIAIVVYLFLFLKKDKPSEPTTPEPAQIEQVADIPSTATESGEAAAVSTDEVSNAQEAPKTDEPKVEVQKQTTTRTTQYSGDLSILNGKTLREKAKVVIRGYFGNNPERKRTLGDAYKEIQDEVNKMYRDGEVR